MNRDKKIKIIAFCLLGIAIAVGIVGTVYMFQTVSTYTFYVKPRTVSLGIYGSYTYPGYYDSISYEHPEAGVMPLVGSLLLISSLVLGILSAKKKKLEVVYPVCGLMGSVLLSAAYGVIAELNYCYDADTGFRLCIAAGAVAFVASVYNLFAVYSPRLQRKKAEKKKKDYVSELMDAKALLDCGALTQEEYEREKARIMSEHGHGAPVQASAADPDPREE